MPVHRLTPLLCLLSIWRILTTVSSHPHFGPCQLIQRTALCNNRKLSSVPEGLPDNTEELQLNYNDILTLQNESLLRYPSLTTLSLACNSLEKLESNTFQDSKLLESLNLANNDLNSNYQESSLALKNLPALRFLDLSENKLEDDMASTLLQNLTSIEYLNLSGNILRRLDETSFRDLHHLKELDLQRNLMFEIDGAFERNPHLRRLNLAFNYLPCLTDFHMTQLVVLNISHNFIEWFISRQDLNETFQLETLDLSDNKLIFFPFLPSQSKLRNLYLSHNTLRFYEHLSDNATLPNSSTTVEFYNINKDLHNVTAQLWDDSLHGDISALEILDLTANKVEYFPQGFIRKMPILSRLHMNTNCLETLNFTSENFSCSLYELDVSNNRLNQISADIHTLAALGNLTYFNLSRNDLKMIPFGLFSSLSNIRSVDLSYNSVGVCSTKTATFANDFSDCVNWQNIVSLRQLHVKGCNLQTIPASAFAGLSLTHLELSDNPGVIMRDSLQSLSQTLQYLGLGNTQIKNLDFSAFRNLKSLNLSRNSLSQIPQSLQSIDLKVLDLCNNNLSSIPSSQAHVLASKLHTVFLTGNPFNCCQTEWFRTFDATKTVTIVARSEIQCKDIFQTHRIKDSQRFSCQEASKSLFWYILLLVPIFLSFAGMAIIVFLAFKPKLLQKSFKKNYLKPTSY
ncbi:Negative regulator of reactive oxygen species [Oryzias melastigma]|uniref:Negative regulator of reactive oxygen species n=1 Tax=Oryzias melastigma TaxID=30732 RepID=A0A834BVX6_ORYME|nr:Negative regulator of reactive oxygen species [Oryzias melastigma]